MRSRQRFDNIAPGPLDEVPYPPQHLDETGREVWNTVGKYLADRGLLSTADLHSLSCYAATVSKIQRLESELKDAPVMVEGARGPVVNPLFAAVNKEHITAKGWALALHAVPVSRVPLSKSVKEEKSATAKGTEWDGVVQMPTRQRGRA